MSISFGTVLIVSALLASIVLAASRGDRIIPLVALVACVIEALIGFGIVTMSVARFRIDIILAAVIAVAGVICWSRASHKSAVTAATVLTVVGAVQLLLGLHLLG